MLLTFILPPGYRRHGVLQQDCAVSSVELEAHELLRAIRGEPADLIDFSAGLGIERTVHAMAQSHAERRWIEV